MPLSTIHATLCDIINNDVMTAEEKRDKVELYTVMQAMRAESSEEATAIATLGLAAEKSITGESEMIGLKNGALTESIHKENMKRIASRSQRLRLRMWFGNQYDKVLDFFESAHVDATCYLAIIVVVGIILIQVAKWAVKMWA